LRLPGAAGLCYDLGCIVTDRLRAAEAAKARALARPDFGWVRDGERLGPRPGEHEPTVTLAIVPSLCSSWCDRRASAFLVQPAAARGRPRVGGLVPG